MQSPQEQRAIVQRMIDAGESEENIATVIRHFKTVEPPRPTPDHPMAKVGRVVSKAVGGYLTGAGLNPQPLMEGLKREAELNSPATLPLRTAVSVLSPLFRLGNVSQKYQNEGLTAAANEVAASVPIIGPAAEHASQRMKSGDTVGGLGEAAGLITSPFLFEGAGRAFPAVKSAVQSRTSTGMERATRAVVDAKVTSDLIKAVPPPVRGGYAAADVQRASPYLASEHAAAPIVSVEGLVNAADSAITQIEEHVASYIASHPRDTIRTNPLAAAQRALANSERTGDMSKGMRALRDLGLDKDMTLAAADAKRLRLNAENKAVLQRNKYDVATARQVDPAFAAREAAAEALRDGIYGQLEARGIEGVRQLRLDEGSLIKIRNSGQRYISAGERPVGGTGKNTVGAKVARVATTGVGAAVGSPFGPVGSGVGAVIGSEIGRKFAPANLTRDALVERAFSKMGNVSGKTYPTVPPDAPIAGQLSAPATALPGAADTSYVRGVPAMVQPPNPARMLPPPQSRPMGMRPDPSHVTTIPARGIVVRDPATGRFKRVYTTEGMTPMASHEVRK